MDEASATKRPTVEEAMHLLAPIVFVGMLAAGANPAAAPGAPLPPVVALDVTGQTQRLRELVRGPTLLVAITDRGAGRAMRAWFDAADARAPGVNRVSIISIGAPFFISDGFARSKAREQVPAPWWHASLFDKDHAMAERLGLGEDGLPYAFAIDGDARVVAVFHGFPSSPDAERIWDAIGRLEAGHGARAASAPP